MLDLQRRWKQTEKIELHQGWNASSRLWIALYYVACVTWL